MMKIFNKVNILVHDKKRNIYLNKKEIYYFSHGIGRKEYGKIISGLNIKHFRNKGFPILKIKYKRSTVIPLFGEEFLYKKQPALLITNNKKRELKEKKIYFQKNNNDNNNKLVTIKLVLLSDIINMKRMFYYCDKLFSISCSSNWVNKRIISIKEMFSGCSSLTSLPDLSFWNIKKVKSLEKMFYNCSSLIFIN